MDDMNSAKKILENLTKFEDTSNYLFIALIIIIIIVIFVVSWVFNTLNKESSACKKLDAIYNDINDYQTHGFLNPNGVSLKEATSDNYFDNSNNCLLRNYYIKTAYNCCCGDGYKNNFVNECALLKCIKLGARCLDFEIYSYNNEPIVAASTANNNSIKETYNSLQLKDVLATLNANCFLTNQDPMFLHFRIMSDNKNIYDKMGDYIKSDLNADTGNLLGRNNYNNDVDSKYIYTDRNSDIRTFILKEHIAKKNALDEFIFKNKFIIIVNTQNTNILNTSKLKDYVNLRSGTNTFQLLRYEQILAAGQDNPLIIDESKRDMIMVLPNISSNIDNFDHFYALNNGIQFIGMKFQNLDNNLLQYFKLFNDAGNVSFVLKPQNRRTDKYVTPITAPGESLDTTSTSGFS
jgi:hypothetical protein